jgi:hypothetical protein
MMPLPRLPTRSETIMRAITRLTTAAVGASLITSLLAACAPGDSTHGIPRIKAKYREAPGRMGGQYGDNNIAWIDDQTVLYVGRDENETSTSLRTWNIATNQAVTIEESIGELCYFDGFVSHYGRQDYPRGTKREGRLGNTSTRHVNLQASLPDRVVSEERVRVNPFNCIRYPAKALAPRESCKSPLLPGDGYIELQGGRCDPAVQQRIAAASNLPEKRREALLSIDRELARNPVRFVNDAKGIAKDLPIHAAEIAHFDISGSYAQWMKRYVLPQTHARDQYTHPLGTWPTEQFIVYLLSNEGEVTSINVPIRKWFHNRPGKVLVSKEGVIAAVPGPRRDGSPSILGIVLFRDQTIELVSDGHTQQLALSPNGCLLAFENRTVPETRADQLVITLRVIDLCEAHR